MGNAFIEEIRKTIEMYDTLFDPEEMANWVVYPVTTETITKYNNRLLTPSDEKYGKRKCMRNWGVSPKAMEKFVQHIRPRGQTQ